MSNMPDPLRAAFTRIKLEKRLAYARAVMHDSRMPETSVLIDDQEIYGIKALVMTMKKHVWAHRMAVVETRHPKTWVDAFKHRWFPGWMLKRWPVVWETYTIEHLRTYPDLVIPGTSSFFSYNILQVHDETIFEPIK